MPPSAEERDAIFKAFGRAYSKQDLYLIYDVVTPGFTWTIAEEGEVLSMSSHEAVAAFFEKRRGRYTDARFEDVIYHHAPEATFMTYRMTGTVAATGETFDRVGVERYTFEGDRLAVKDVYSRPAS